MEKIGMKKATCDQLPQLESHRSVELSDSKMPNRPERECGKQSRAGYRFNCENRDVYADEQSCESRHNQPNGYLISHEGHEGSQRTTCYEDILYHNTESRSRRRTKMFFSGSCLFVRKMFLEFLFSCFFFLLHHAEV